MKWLLTGCNWRNLSLVIGREKFMEAVLTISKIYTRLHGNVKDPYAVLYRPYSKKMIGVSLAIPPRFTALFPELSIFQQTSLKEGLKCLVATYEFLLLNNIYNTITSWFDVLALFNGCVTS